MGPGSASVFKDPGLCPSVVVTTARFGRRSLIDGCGGTASVQPLSIAALLITATPWITYRNRWCNAGNDVLTAGDEQVGVDQHGVGHHPLIIWIDQPELKRLFWSELDGLIVQEHFDSMDLGCWHFGLAAHQRAGVEENPHSHPEMAANASDD
jgi:hypothetical protein